MNIAPPLLTGSLVSRLQDSGNFVVQDETRNTTLWQSFDHPTNCLLPGMKLGYNLTTMQNWTTYSSYIDEKRKEEAYIRELTASTTQI